MKYRYIQANVGGFSVSELCRVLSVSASGYYDWLNRPLSNRRVKDAQLSEKIISIHSRSHSRYGSPRIHQSLLKDGENIGRNRVIKLMREHSLKAVGKRKFKATTNSRHNKPVADNLVRQRFNVDEPNKVWAGDISYVATDEGWLYLAVVIDLYSRKVIGWSMDKRMTRQLVIDALLAAYWRRKPKQLVIHHSDRGVQYASSDFQAQLQRLNMIPSMSAKGCCYDNAVVESFFHTLKVELVYQQRFKAREEAKSEIFKFIELFYNSQRLHSTLGYCSPNEFERLQEIKSAA